MFSLCFSLVIWFFHVLDLYPLSAVSCFLYRVWQGILFQFCAFWDMIYPKPFIEETALLPKKFWLKLLGSSKTKTKAMILRTSLAILHWWNMLQYQFRFLGRENRLYCGWVRNKEFIVIKHAGQEELRIEMTAFEILITILFRGVLESINNSWKKLAWKYKYD